MSISDHTRRDRPWTIGRPRSVAIAGLALTLGLVTAGCSGDPAEDEGSTAKFADLSEPVTIAGESGDTPAELSVAVSRALFDSSPAVVVAASDDAKGMTSGADDAASLGVPMLVVDDEPTTAQQEEIERLDAEHVLAMSSQVADDLQDLSDAEVVTSAKEITATPAKGSPDLALLVRSDGSRAGSAAATASAKAAGARVIRVTGPDLRSDLEAIAALAEHDPDRVLAVGSDFGPLESLTARLDVARTGVELPGGGQALFPGRLLVAMYGTPHTAGLGVLGEQGVEASITRARGLAEDYEELTDDTVVPTFEIIATVAQSEPGPDGDYSGEIGVEELRPWVEKAGEEGVYVVLDLQPGRANFLDQAKLYEDLLTMPHVGLALDPEWRLKPTQKPLGQIGSVEAEEVNSVITWLGELTREEKLPQKLLVLHQFRVSMLQDQDQIDMDRDEVQVLVHMDGQGAPSLKDETWQAVKAAAAKDTPFGWKNFYDEDQPMLSAEVTMTKKPTPVMVSYQ